MKIMLNLSLMCVSNHVHLFFVLGSCKLWPCICLFIQLCTAALRLIVQSWLDVPTFATRRLHVTAPSGRRYNCGRELFGIFAEIMTSMPFRELLHVVKLRLGTNGFTSPLKEGVLRIFSP
jgi:hypothetical protein